LLQNIPEAQEEPLRASLLFGNMDTFLLWNLTGAQGGIHATDVTNASRTQLLKLKKHWIGMKSARNVCDSSRGVRGPVEQRSVWGSVTYDHPGVPSADSGDQQAALVGQACFGPAR